MQTIQITGHEIYVVKGPKGCGKTTYLEKVCPDTKRLFCTSTEFFGMLEGFNKHLEGVETLIIDCNSFNKLDSLKAELKNLLYSEKLNIRELFKPIRCVPNKINKIFVEIIGE